MKIANFLDRDIYLLNPIMKKFLKDRGVSSSDIRSDLIKKIEEYSNIDSIKEDEVREWIYQTIREGSKEFCYRKIYNISETYKIAAVVEDKILSAYPECPKKGINEYLSKKERKLIDYRLILNEKKQVEKIEFTFSQLAYQGSAGEIAEITTIFPIFIDVYMDKGLIISRTKAKSTLYKYDEANEMLHSEYKIHTMDEAVNVIDELVDLFEFQTEYRNNVVENENSQMLFKLYEKYSSIPQEIEEKIKSKEEFNKSYIQTVFDHFKLDIRNKEKALIDMNIFLEKYISINGDEEELFKKDKKAYLVKVLSDDEIGLATIDATAHGYTPLQCTEVFFDSKKSVIQSKKCDKINIVIKRDDESCVKQKPLIVQFGFRKNYGYFKSILYAEEVDIQYVIQTICANYRNLK